MILIILEALLRSPSTGTPLNQSTSLSLPPRSSLRRFLLLISAQINPPTSARLISPRKAKRRKSKTFSKKLLSFLYSLPLRAFFLTSSKVLSSVNSGVNIPFSNPRRAIRVLLLENGSVDQYLAAPSTTSASPWKPKPHRRVFSGVRIVPFLRIVKETSSIPLSVEVMNWKLKPSLSE